MLFAANRPGAAVVFLSRFAADFSSKRKAPEAGRPARRGPNPTLPLCPARGRVSGRGAGCCLARRGPCGTCAADSDISPRPAELGPWPGPTRDAAESVRRWVDHGRRRWVIVGASGAVRSGGRRAGAKPSFPVAKKGAVLRPAAAVRKPEPGQSRPPWKRQWRRERHSVASAAAARRRQRQASLKRKGKWIQVQRRGRIRPTVGFRFKLQPLAGAENSAGLPSLCPPTNDLQFKSRGLNSA